MEIIGVKVEGRSGEESDFEIFKLNEVNYINLIAYKKSIQIPVYHTVNGSFAPLLTLRDISKALKKYGFEHFDKSTIVNTRRIKGIKRGENVLLLKFVDLSEITVSARSRFR